MANSIQEVSFDVTSAERELIGKIVTRAQKEGLCRSKAKPSHWYDGLTMTMDLAACHANGCRLDLKRFLAGDACRHRAHLNRETGELDNCFLPRLIERKAA